jgi:hypothetical protein
MALGSAPAPSIVPKSPQGQWARSTAQSLIAARMGGKETYLAELDAYLARELGGRIGALRVPALRPAAEQDSR